jgi:hypothetical protein
VYAPAIVVAKYPDGGTALVYSDKPLLCSFIKGEYSEAQMEHDVTTMLTIYEACEEAERLTFVEQFVDQMRSEVASREFLQSCTNSQKPPLNHHGVEESTILPMEVWERVCSFLPAVDLMFLPRAGSFFFSLRQDLVWYTLHNRCLLELQTHGIAASMRMNDQSAVVRVEAADHRGRFLDFVKPAMRQHSSCACVPSLEDVAPAGVVRICNARFVITSVFPMQLNYLSPSRRGAYLSARVVVEEVRSHLGLIRFLCLVAQEPMEGPVRSSSFVVVDPDTRAHIQCCLSRNSQSHTQHSNVEAVRASGGLRL